MNFWYLIKRRERPVGFKRFLIVWAKRAILLFPLITLYLRYVRLSIFGATIGKVVYLGELEINGPACNLRVGDYSSIGKCGITLHDKVTVGNNAVLNDGVSILTASHRLDDPSWQTKTAPILIGDFAWIASNAVILPGVSIGYGAVVGAGAVVRCDVPDFCLAVGNPAVITTPVRNTKLEYYPSLLCAPFEAWVGKC